MGVTCKCKEFYTVRTHDDKNTIGMRIMLLPRIYLDGATKCLYQNRCQYFLHIFRNYINSAYIRIFPELADVAFLSFN